MIQLFGLRRDKRVTRKGVALLLTFWLNLVLLPCAMAVEVPDDGHDCCPPTIELQAVECCEVDSAALDKRDSKFEVPDDLTASSMLTAWPSSQMASRPLSLPRPPDPAGSSPPLHKLFCVYLK